MFRTTSFPSRQYVILKLAVVVLYKYLCGVASRDVFRRILQSGGARAA